MLALRIHEQIRGQNFESSILKKHEQICLCHIELLLVRADIIKKAEKYEKTVGIWFKARVIPNLTLTLILTQI